MLSSCWSQSSCFLNIKQVSRKRKKGLHVKCTFFIAFCDFYRLTERFQLILVYKNDPELLVIREKLLWLHYQLCVLHLYLWPLYKHVVHVKKMLASGENLLILRWRLRCVPLPGLLGMKDGVGGEEHLEQGKVLSPPVSDQCGSVPPAWKPLQ